MLCVSAVFAVDRCLSVYPSLCLSVAFLYYIQTAKDSQTSVWPRTTKFDKITRGEGRVSRGSVMPNARGRERRAAQIWGFPSIYAYTLWRRTTKYVVVNTYGSGLFLGRQPSLPSQDSGVPALPNFVVLLYLCLVCLNSWTQNDQIRHSNTWGGACFREVSHAIAFAQMRRAVCRRQLSFFVVCNTTKVRSAATLPWLRPCLRSQMLDMCIWWTGGVLLCRYSGAAAGGLVHDRVHRSRVVRRMQVTLPDRVRSSAVCSSSALHRRRVVDVSFFITTYTLSLV